MLKNVIFDFDGVIADTFDINWPLSKQQDETATMEDFLAHHDGNVYDEPKIKFKPEGIPVFWDEYAKRLTPQHLEKAAGPLKRLSQKYSLFILSSSQEQMIKDALKQAELLDLFVLVMGKETHTSKVEKFKMLIDKHGITEDNSVFITDTLGDIKEAHKVGIRTIAETFGFHPRERLALGSPFKIVDSWEEIESTIRSL